MLCACWHGKCTLVYTLLQVVTLFDTCSSLFSGTMECVLAPMVGPFL